jgi:hypothetical protein
MLVEIAAQDLSGLVARQCGDELDLACVVLGRPDVSRGSSSALDRITCGGW